MTDKTYTLTGLSTAEMNTIFAALAQRPWGEVNDLVVKLSNQVKDSEAAPTEKTAPKGK